MELMAQISDYSVGASELEALRLAPMTDVLVKLAEKNPEPLRQYEGYLMQTYRLHRSVFNLPPTDLLKSILKRLLETNPANQRVYKCHLAEIASDLGDDAACLDLASSALDPNIDTGGPASFSMDPKAPEIVLLRTMDVLSRNLKTREAISLYQNATRQGLVATEPALQVLASKLERSLMKEESHLN
jgi:hypothetical protein